MEGNSLPFPKEDDFWNVLAEEQPLRSFDILSATKEEIESSVRSLRFDPIGIHISENLAYKILFPSSHRDDILLLNEDLVRNRNSIVSFLLETKVIASIIASRNLETGQYEINFLILSSPTGSENRVEIVVCSLDGKIDFAGRVNAMNNKFEFEFDIRALKRAPFLVHLRGTITNNIVELQTRQYSPRRKTR